MLSRTSDERVAVQLEGLLESFDEVQRARSPLEAPWPFTRPYVQLQFAWGFARLGFSQRARRRRDKAAAALEGREGPHPVLRAAWLERIEEALAGLPPSARFSDAVSRAWEQLHPVARYRADQLREFSRILEPAGLDAREVFLSRGSANRELDVEAGKRPALVRAIDPRLSAGPREEALLELQASNDPTLAAAALTIAAAQALGALEAEAMLGSQGGVLAALQRVMDTAEPVRADQRLPVLRSALKLAGESELAPQVMQLVRRISAALEALGDDAEHFEPVLGPTLRVLHRLGLQREGEALLARAARAFDVPGVTAVCGRLALAGGAASRGERHQAEAIFEAVLGRRQGDTGVFEDRVRLWRAAADALALADTPQALRWLVKLGAQLPEVTDALGANAEFCLALVAFADALVLGHVGEQAP